MTDGSKLGVQRCVAIVVAGGQGSRFGSGVPKQLVNLGGHPILHHTLRRLDEASAVTGVIIAANREWQTEIAEIAEYSLRKTPHVVVDGGSSRNESILSALEPLATLDQNLPILVHDAVRPFIKDEIISRVLEGLREHRAVIPVVASADPLVRVSGDTVVAFEERTEVYRGQSPQGFYLGDLKRAFSNRDDLGSYATAFEVLRSHDPEIAIGYVDGDMDNIKITTPVDHVIAGQLLLEG